MVLVSSVATTQATTTSTSSAPVSTSTPKVVSATKVESAMKQTTEEIVRDYFKTTPIMVEVARCESRFTQFDKDGSIHRGVINDADVGVMQINEFYHLEKSKQLGMDIHTLEGNLDYAKYLYEKQGTAPWKASSKCWGKYTEVAKK